METARFFAKDFEESGAMQRTCLFMNLAGAWGWGWHGGSGPARDTAASVAAPPRTHAHVPTHEPVGEELLINIAVHV
jgi:hypothetical protein